MGSINALFIVVFFTVAFGHNVDRQRLRRRTPKMTLQWRQEQGLGSFNEVGTAGGNSLTKPKTAVLECTQEGYFPQPGSCSAFYRCVDWLGTGAYFSTFKFNCPFGTVFDDDLDVCNHPGAVRNPAECSGAAGILPLPEPPGVDSTISGGQSSGSEGTSSIGDDTKPCNSTLAPYPEPETTTTSFPTTPSTEAVTIGFSTTSESTTLFNVEETTYSVSGTTSISDLDKTTGSFFETTTTISPDGLDENGEFTCPAAGYYPFQDDCVRFYKCIETDDGSLRELLYRCPDGYGYSEERKRCWKLVNLPPCNRTPTAGAYLRGDVYTQLQVQDLLWFFD